MHRTVENMPYQGAGSNQHAQSPGAKEPKGQRGAAFVGGRASGVVMVGSGIRPWSVVQASVGTVMVVIVIVIVVAH